jgi:hypothetical protein
VFALLSHLQSHHHLLPHTTFLDAGCGNGEVVLSAAFHPTVKFALCRGIDIEPERIDTATLMLGPTAPPLPEHATIRFDVGDLRQEDVLGSAGVVFLNGPHFDATLSHMLADQMSALPPQSMVVSTSRRYPCPDFDHVSTLLLPSNGLGKYGEDGQLFTFFILQKRAPVPPVLEGDINNVAGNIVSATSPSVTDAPYSDGFRTHAQWPAFVKACCTLPTGMMTLSHLFASETTTRHALGADGFLLSHLTVACGDVEASLGKRAGLFMLLFAASAHPTGAHTLSNHQGGVFIEKIVAHLEAEENDTLTATLVSLLSNLLAVKQCSATTAVWQQGKHAVEKAARSEAVQDAAGEFNRGFEWNFGLPAET